MILDTDKRYKRMLDEVDQIPRFQLIIGIFIAALFMVGTTYGVLVFLDILGILDMMSISLGYSLPDIIRYTGTLTLISFGVAGFAALICLIIMKYPNSVFLPLKIHQFFKRGIGQYFLSPNPSDQNWGLVIRRSIYGSILVTGFSLTIIGFDMVQTGFELVAFGGIVMVISVAILPFTLMQFYFGPWLLKDAGLFHLDQKDRSLSNVGDDLEDILEFVAGVDVVLVIVQITLSTDIWVAAFIFIVFLGPLFAIILNFTIVFMFVKNNVLNSMITRLTRDYDYPDMIGSGDYIRHSIVELVDNQLVYDSEGTSVAPSFMEEATAIEEGLHDSSYESDESGPIPEFDDDENDAGPEQSSDNEI